MIRTFTTKAFAVGGVAVPVGTAAELEWLDAEHRLVARVAGFGEPVEVRGRTLRAFSGPDGEAWAWPTGEALEEWTGDSVCPSLDGDEVEPDGVSEGGMPSWLMYLGLV